MFKLRLRLEVVGQAENAPPPAANLMVIPRLPPNASLSELVRYLAAEYVDSTLQQVQNAILCTKDGYMI